MFINGTVFSLLMTKKFSNTRSKLTSEVRVSRAKRHADDNHDDDPTHLTRRYDNYHFKADTFASKTIILLRKVIVIIINTIIILFTTKMIVVNHKATQLNDLKPFKCLYCCDMRVYTQWDSMQNPIAD